MRTVITCAVAIGMLGCGEAQDRVRRVPSVKSEYHFRTYCKRFDACLRDAREICPDGYSKEEVAPNELVFWCHGKADW
jgi:hypothetical protein